MDNLYPSEDSNKNTIREKSLNKDELKKKKVVQLKDILRKQGKKVSGRKADLIDRILGKEEKVPKRKLKDIQVKETSELKKGDKYNVYDILRMRRNNKIKEKLDNACFYCLNDITGISIERRGVLFCENCFRDNVTVLNARSSFKISQRDLRTIPTHRSDIGFYFTFENVAKVAEKNHGSLKEVLRKKLKDLEEGISKVKDSNNSRLHLS